ncbi:hypothetical protein SAMN05660772_01152 [Pasteurella testudinis DSM 23072]|uniref:Pilus assembly protein PilP n=1 Tax=Pasteurella testudinis DSM 23072 TaxID=1122938 RepID=A0A1W1V546_9PAST|nr:hypothetical protein [Pasteurella testudinis]SMB88270.1 hypothetical protein SAMN05660772_01152 [Pasteurella testudinis DSM 23072]SUB51145.1 Uncharacterised protein [Pasteurella testudinis]
MNKFYLTALLCVCCPVLATDSTFADPFVLKQSVATVSPTKNAITPPAGSQCTPDSLLLMDTLPLEQIKPVGLIRYHEYAIVLWATPDEVIIDSRLHDVVSQQQWQIVAIEAQRIRLQSCHDPQLQRHIHL